MCEIESWLPNVVATTLRGVKQGNPQSIIVWLTKIRGSVEEYDPLVTVRAQTSSSDTSSTPDSAFDEILSHLGKEIFKLDQYQKNLTTENDQEVSLSILNIFNECLDDMIEEKTCHEEECSEDSFVTSTPCRDTSRGRLKTDSTGSSYGLDIEKDYEWTKLIESDTDDSESTCWSYKVCSEGEVESKNTYSSVWSHSSGYHNSDAILKRVLSHNRAVESQVSFDTVTDFAPVDYNVYSFGVGENVRPVTMSPATPTDEYEPIRQDENIYEEINFNYTDEGCSCGSVEVDTCSMSECSTRSVGRESPFYANLRDNDAYAITPDVIFWRKLLWDPFYIDDEEDEWITPEECAVYSREQKPPFVIPRIQYRAPKPRMQPQQCYPEDGHLKGSMRQYERLGNWSPTSERGALDLERSFSKDDSPPFGRVHNRLGGSTENLLINTRRPQHLQIPASSSGDSLDVEMRERDIGHARSRKSRSMVAPKHRVKSPVPAPRMMLPVTPEAQVILEGPVKRTKFFENGKKSKKNWTECFMVLTHTALVFYKDHRTYHASKLLKPPGTPPSPGGARAELVLPLRNARVLQCMPMHTRRHTRSLVLTVDYDQYLIQDDAEEGIKRWLHHIQNVIYKLYPPMLNESPTSQYQSSNTDLESLGRTPPVSRHATRNKQKVGGSSNEDLSETEVSKSHVRSRLRKFFAKRPAMEVLVKKGIYKDEPVFGRNLEEVCPASSPRVPEFVVACVREIESNEENMCTDGLYRASGNLSQVQKIRLEIDQNNLNVIENNTDIHVLTGSLKLFFRELKEPLIPCTMFDRVLAACSIKPKEAKIKEFRDIVQSLPQCNRDTLKYLLEHLIRVTEYSERNRMHTANLAIVFGPTLLWAPAAQAHNIAVDCIQQNNVVDILLNDFKEIFEEKGKKKA